MSKYSSFKSHQLITENWRKFLGEDKIPEDYPGWYPGIDDDLAADAAAQAEHDRVAPANRARIEAEIDAAGGQDNRDGLLGIQSTLQHFEKNAPDQAEKYKIKQAAAIEKLEQMKAAGEAAYNAAIAELDS
tara:strand:+ start:41 stop:433 length:393 start_codon:yes stop_codon:yes gene_type:complete